MRIIKIPLLCILFFSFLYCEREAEKIPRDQPVVISCSPVVNTGSIEFVGEIVSLGFQEILEYGFVWSEHPEPSNVDHKILLEDNPTKGFYSYKMQVGIVNNESYYFRAYILTDKRIIYGIIKSGTSL